MGNDRNQGTGFAQLIMTTGLRGLCLCGPKVPLQQMPTATVPFFAVTLPRFFPFPTAIWALEFHAPDTPAVSLGRRYALPWNQL